MKMTGEQKIAAPRERVWEALNDAEVLRQCIPGCQSLEKEADDRMTAVVEIKIGPIGARFKGAVTLSELDPPASYTITGEGQGGTVGSAKGGAKVSLVEDCEGTLLTYDVDAQVGGRLAQLGGPIIDATAKQLAGKFFTKFGEVVGQSVQPAPNPASLPSAATPAADAPPAVVPQTVAAAVPAPAAAVPAGAPWGWIAAVVLALLAGFYLGVGGMEREWLLLVAIVVIVAAAAGYESGKRSGGSR
jgi:carbon monoxide dehydrogenase subunit G